MRDGNHFIDLFFTVVLSNFSLYGRHPFTEGFCGQHLVILKSKSLSTYNRLSDNNNIIHNLGTYEVYLHIVTILNNKLNPKYIGTMYLHIIISYTGRFTRYAYLHFISHKIL